MKSSFLRILNPIGFILFAAIAIALQSSLFRFWILPDLQPEWLLLWVVWCAMKRPWTEGGVLTLILGQMLESQSGAPLGFYMMDFIAIYLIVRGLIHFVLIERFESLILMTLIACGIHFLNNVILMFAIDELDSALRSLIVQCIPTAVLTALTGYVLYPLFNKFDLKTRKQIPTESLDAEEDLTWHS